MGLGLAIINLVSLLLVSPRRRFIGSLIIFLCGLNIGSDVTIHSSLLNLMGGDLYLCLYMLVDSGYVYVALKKLGVTSTVVWIVWFFSCLSAKVANPLFMRLNNMVFMTHLLLFEKFEQKNWVVLSFFIGNSLRMLYTMEVAVVGLLSVAIIESYQVMGWGIPARKIAMISFFAILGLPFEPDLQMASALVINCLFVFSWFLDISKITCGTVLTVYFMGPRIFSSPILAPIWMLGRNFLPRRRSGGTVVAWTLVAVLVVLCVMDEFKIDLTCLLVIVPIIVWCLGTYMGANLYVEKVKDLGIKQHVKVINEMRESFECSVDHSGLLQGKRDPSNAIVAFVFSISGMLALTYFPFEGAVLGSLGLAIAYFSSELSNQRTEPLGFFSDTLKTGKKHVTFEDGIYSITSKTLLGNFSQIGVGTVIDGVFHTSYHVTRGNVLNYGEDVVCPTEADVMKDRITYGGKMRFKIATTEKVQLQALKPDGQLEVVEITPAQAIIKGADYDGIAYAFTQDYPRGTSGSPIFDLSGNLVGLYGNGFNVPVTEGGYVNIYYPPDGDQTPDYNEKYAKVGTETGVYIHPGAGKTRKYIKRMVEESLADNRPTIVLAPTRVVVGEMRASLPMDRNVTFHTSEDIRPFKGLVQVMCHATMVHRILRKKFTEPQLYIFDEAHNPDPMAIAARGFISEKVSSKKAAVVWLTATPPHEAANDGSNCAIEEIQMCNQDINNSEPTVNYIDSLGGRKLVFVKSRERADNLAGNVKNGLSLHRGNYAKNRVRVFDEKVKTIVTTDISEMGANFQVDHVIDTMETCKPILVDPNTVRLETIDITRASQVQRRGRVGRTKPGHYHWFGSTDDNTQQMAKWIEARILLDVIHSLPFWHAEVESSEPPGGRIMSTHAIPGFISKLDDYSIFSAYRMTIDQDWATAGHQVYKNKKITLRGKEVDFKPTFIDERTFCDSHKRFLKDTGYRGGISLGLEDILNEAFRAIGVTKSYFNGVVPNKNDAKSSLTIVSLEVLLIANLAMMGVFGVCRGIEMDRFRTSLLFLCCLLGVLFQQGVGLIPISIGAIFGFIVLCCLIPERSSFRSTWDNTLHLVVLVMSMVTGVIIAFELDMFPRTFAFMGRTFFANNTRNVLSELPIHAYNFNTKLSNEMILGEPQLPQIWGAVTMVLAFIVPGIRAAHTAKCIRDSDNEDDKSRPNISVGWPMTRALEAYFPEGLAAFVLLCSGPMLTWFSILTIGASISIMVITLLQTDKADILGKALRTNFLKKTRNLADHDGTPAFKHTLFELVSDPLIHIAMCGGMVLSVCYALVFISNYRNIIQCGALLVSCAWSLWGSSPGGIVLDTIFSPGGCMGLVSLLYRNWQAIFVLGIGAYYRNQKKGYRGFGNVDLAGEQWKNALNQMSSSSFNKYRTHKVVERKKEQSVSRGAHKMDEIIRKFGWVPKGDVIDLGCGQGGWSQRMAVENEVDTVRGHTIGGTHAAPSSIKTYGHESITLFDHEDVFTKELSRKDTIVCDIGEQDNNWKIEAQRTAKVIELVMRWLSFNPTARFCFKVLCPYDTNVMQRLRNLQRKYGGRLIRLTGSRNSNHEMYMISGQSCSLINSVATTTIMLQNRMNENWKEKILLEDITYPEGEKSIVEPSFPPESAVKNRIKYIKATHPLIKHDIKPYKYWDYYGSWLIEAKNAGGQAVNGIVQMLIEPWKSRTGILAMQLTDCSVAGIQEMFKRKLDVKAPEPQGILRKINVIATEWLFDFMFREIKPRICTKEEFIAKIRSNMAVGAFTDEMNFESARAAVEDPKFWQLVDKERQFHLKGDCKNCVYNTMAKREKKSSVIGIPKSSRLIWYLWLGARFLEFEALGFLNEDHVVSPENSKAGVGGVGLQYLGYHLAEKHSRYGGAVAEDTASWDTRISEMDLEMEEKISEHCGSYHSKLVKSIYFVYRNKVAMVPRVGTDGRHYMDAIGRTDQRGSGEVVTYALNTITNIRVQLCRLLEARGVIHPTCDLKNLCDVLLSEGEAFLDRMIVAGDDCVVWPENDLYRTSLWYLTKNGKVRKNMAIDAPSVVIDQLEKIEFCSHHFHAHLWHGEVFYFPCRQEDEIIGRWRVQMGMRPNLRESCGLAKAYAQQGLLFFFHRRDIRLLSMAVCSSVPVDWVPTGRTTWSIHQNHEWMTTDDMLDVWNRIWVRDNPFNKRKVEAQIWQDVPRIRRGADEECGALLQDNSRAKWAKNLPNMIAEIRTMVGNESYRDYLEESFQKYQAPREQIGFF